MVERKMVANRKVGVRTDPAIDLPSISIFKRGVPRNSFGIEPLRLLFPSKNMD